MTTTQGSEQADSTQIAAVQAYVVYCRAYTFASSHSQEGCWEFVAVADGVVRDAGVNGVRHE